MRNYQNQNLKKLIFDISFAIIEMENYAVIEKAKLTVR